MTTATGHPVFAAIQPLLEVLGGAVIKPDELQSGDVPISWEEEVIGGIRLDSLSNALDRLVTHIEEELGGKLVDLPREKKQAAVRMLDEDGLALDVWYVGFRQENGRMGICRARDFLQNMAGTVAHPLKSII